MHLYDIVHHDLKCANILVNPEMGHHTCIADFGSAFFDRGGQSADFRTVGQGTPNYLPPEALLGSTVYGTACDVWSLGCVLSEVCLRGALFIGSGTQQVLASIFAQLGKPSGNGLMLLRRLPYWSEFQFPVQPVYPAGLEEHIGHYGMNLLAQLFAYDWNNRPKALTIMNDPFFFALTVMHPAPQQFHRSVQAVAKIAMEAGAADDDAAARAAIHPTEPADEVVRNQIQPQACLQNLTWSFYYPMLHVETSIFAATANSKCM